MTDRDLTADMAAHARREAGQPSRTDLHIAVEAAVGPARRALGDARAVDRRIAAAVMAIVLPELDRGAAERDEACPAMARVRSLLPADRAEDMNASWLPIRRLRDAVDGTGGEQ